MIDADYRDRVSGKNYVHFLEQLHKHLMPKTYFEIGVQFGTTLALAECASIAVDPQLNCQTNVIGKKPICHFFQQSSDEFFAAQRPSQIFGQPIDLAFLDGLHWFEFLLRDFINTERHCSRDSTVILHDCLPPGFYMTSRDIADASNPLSAFGGWWAGDVWKMVPTLRKYRPDLTMIVTDCSPTGLVIISGLNPENNVLKSHYEQIIGEFKRMDRAEFDAHWAVVDVVPAISIDFGSDNGDLNWPVATSKQATA